MLAVLLSSGFAVLGSQGAFAQTILNGVYNNIFIEDLGSRGGGPAQGDYTGVPMTDAARSIAQLADPEDVTLSDWQCRPHPSHYSIRGPGQLRVWERLDPQTLQQVELQMHMVFPQRDIWMDGRPHPPQWAPHTWSGFSSGNWIGDVLHVRSDMFKRAWIERNGVPTSDKLVVEEYFFRDGDILTHIGVFSDPEYLSEPMIRSTNFQVTENVPNVDPFPCRPLTEDVRPRGLYPMHLPNQTAVVMEWASEKNVPLEAAMGGAETLLPEYQDKMVKLPPNQPLATLQKLEREQDVERK